MALFAVLASALTFHASAATGDLVWEASLPDMPRSILVSDSGTVFAIGRDYVMSISESGSTNWVQSTVDGLNLDNTGTGAVLPEDELLVIRQGGATSVLTLFNSSGARSGNHFVGPGELRYTPAITADGLIVVQDFSTTESHIRGISPRLGEQWALTNKPLSNAGLVITSDGKIVGNTDTNKLAAILPSGAISWELTYPVEVWPASAGRSGKVFVWPTFSAGGWLSTLVVNSSGHIETAIPSTTNDRTPLDISGQPFNSPFIVWLELRRALSLDDGGFMINSSYSSRSSENGLLLWLGPSSDSQFSGLSRQGIGYFIVHPAFHGQKPILRAIDIGCSAYKSPWLGLDGPFDGSRRARPLVTSGPVETISATDGGRSVQLTFVSVPGITYRVLESSDSMRWTTKANLVSGSTNLTLKIPITSDFHFFKIQSR